MNLRRSLLLFLPASLTTLGLGFACSSQSISGVEGAAGSGNDFPRVDWEFGGGGASAGGAGGRSGTETDLSMKRFNAAEAAYKGFISDCNTLEDKRFGYPVYASLPYYSALFECVVASKACATMDQFLCKTYPDEWDDCFDAVRTFTCDSGEIIRGDYRCDIIKDCEDGEDERGCQDLWYQCDDGAPILASQRCDNTAQCDDGSDEENCNIQYFTCDFRKGIPDWQVCNLYSDCTDNSDEDQNCARATCN